MTGTATEHTPSPAALFALAERWSGARAAERANAQSYLIELAAASRERLRVRVPGQDCQP
jgi:hypothetical protein